MAKQFSSTKQQQVLKQKLSHQNIQLFKMMELNLLQFDQKVKEELDLNPALENLDNYESNIYEKSLDNIISQHSNPPDQATQSNNRTEDFYTKSTNIENSRDLENYQTSPNYNHESNTMGDEHDLYIPIEDNDSFVSNLQNQLKYITTSDSQLVIGEFILGNLDDDGYLRRSLSQIVDDLSFRQNIVVSEEDVKTVLEMIQDLDPPGVGASNLQELNILNIRFSR
jgi:RNA polymerase sigma-54 factor